ncbi:MAG: hypothetical protein P8046_12785 [Anaerolineales bacterium]
MTKTKIFLLAICIFSLLIGLFPVTAVQAEPTFQHPFENSALLMFSANMRLDGDVHSAQGVSGHLLVPSLQASDGNEIDVLIDLYSAQIVKLRDSDTYSLGQEAQLIAQLEAKVQALNQRAQELRAARNPIQPRRGLGRALRWAAGKVNRSLKGVGRVTGKLVGAVMDGSGKIVEFAIEEVAPRVLKEALQSGVPINMALVRRITRELLINRVTDAFVRDQQRRAEGVKDLDPGEQATLAADIATLSDLDNAPGTKTEEAISLTLESEDSDELELTTQEEANKGTHTYLVVCHGGELACASRPTIQVEMSVVFVEGGVKVNGIMRQKVGRNQYVWEDYMLTFTMDGMTNAFPDGSSDVYSRQD